MEGSGTQAVSLLDSSIADVAPSSLPPTDPPSSPLRRTLARFSASSPTRQGVSRGVLRSSPARSRAGSKSGSLSISPPADLGSSPPRASSSMSTTLSEDDTVTASSAYQGGASLSRPFTAPQPSTSFAASSSSMSLGSVPAAVAESESESAATNVRPHHRQRAASSTALPRLAPPMHTPATSRPVSTSPSPANLSLQSVLFNGLLNATLSDLNLVAFNRFYRLHRLVLAGQSGFFNSLLSGGFAEQHVASGKRNSDVVTIELAPPMQRNAFEFCLARLYGGGPDLVPPLWAQASVQYPLSAMFDALQRAALGAEARLGDDTPKVPQNAFYACGEPCAQDVTNLDEPCPGLEHIGRQFKHEDMTASMTEPSDAGDDAPSEHLALFVGPEGERVGEACACWLAKWGSDILHVEEWLASEGADEDAISLSVTANGVVPSPPPLVVWSSKPGGLSARWVRGIISSDAFFVPFSNSPNDAEIDLDSLDLGTDGEFQRYLFAKRVVQMRRSECAQRRRESVDSAAERLQHVTLQDDGSETGENDSQKCGTRAELLLDKVELDADDEAEYDELFAGGIHYSHMLQYVAADVCSITGKPFVRQSIVERALWESEAFKVRIPTTPSSRFNYHAAYGSTRSPGQESMVDERPELGLVFQIDPTKPRQNGPDWRPYYLVPVDDTTRINERPATSSESSENVAETASPPTPKKPSTLPRGPEHFFGLALETRAGTVGPVSFVYGTADEADSDRRWVAHEPCRVSIEFWGVQALKDKQRLYSSTFFYAGSFYNLYLQKIQKKGSLQLGIYLHRQNPSEPFPVPSQPPFTATTLQKSRATAPSLAPYTDRRKQIRAFFSIWCPTHLGTSMTKFSSGPDSFALSQSWGWKSTSLSQEFLGSVTGVPENGLDQVIATSSLRVTIVMGIV
ncbi:hypothetical protein OIV83_003925 [Microbotryomycetes sp. JL201]|nr:hypothetical protein OIV83_003925 [Microbotryomycetes sp. JL201]